MKNDTDKKTGSVRRPDGNAFDRRIKPQAAAEGAVIGRNAVRELYKSGRSIDKLFVRRGDREGSITTLIAEAKRLGIPVIEVDAAKLDAMSGGISHQGIIAMAAERDYQTVEDMIDSAKRKNEYPLIVIADDVTDPQNLGAVIRCAECSGAHGIIIPKRHSAGLTPAVTRASAGAIEHMMIAKSSNLAQTVEQLKDLGVWIFAAEAGGTPYYECKFDSPTAIIFGSEGEGVSRLLRERSDFIVSIPMRGQVNSLNVSCASAVILSEAARQLSLSGGA